MAEKEDTPRDDVSEKQLDEASEDSFPASDPPSYSEPVPDKHPDKAASTED